MSKNLVSVLLVAMALVGLYFKVEFSGIVLFIGILAVLSCDWEDEDD